MSNFPDPAESLGYASNADLRRVANQTTELQQQITDLGTTVNTVRDDVGTLRTEVSTVNTAVSGVSGQVNQMQSLLERIQAQATRPGPLPPQQRVLPPAADPVAARAEPLPVRERLIDREVVATSDRPAANNRLFLLMLVSLAAVFCVTCILVSKGFQLDQANHDLVAGVKTDVAGVGAKIDTLITTQPAPLTRSETRAVVREAIDDALATDRACAVAADYLHHFKPGPAREHALASLWQGRNRQYRASCTARWQKDGRMPRDFY